MKDKKARFRIEEIKERLEEIRQIDVGPKRREIMFGYEYREALPVKKVLKDILDYLGLEYTKQEEHALVQKEGDETAND